MAKESMAVESLGNGADVDEEQDGKKVVDRDDRERVVRSRLGGREVSTVKVERAEAKLRQYEVGASQEVGVGALPIATYGIICIPMLGEEASCQAPVSKVE